MSNSGRQLVVVGGGPAGLRAAEVASAAGVRTLLFEGKRSVGRKFLIAGKGGLNLTHAEPAENFVTRYRGPEMPSDFWPQALETFSNQAMRGWAARLEVGTFVATSGRVYPKALKGAPLLRAWVRRLKEQGVAFHMNHRLLGLERGERFRLRFDHAGEVVEVEAEAVILALGGGSWPQTGSDGMWTSMLEQLGIAVHPLTAANCGWEVAWDEAVLQAAEGRPLKNLTVQAGGQVVPGELVVTRYGLEGGPIYHLGPLLREMAEPMLEIDFKPTFSEEKLVAKMESAKRNFLAEAQVRWKLSAEAAAILESQHGPFESAADLARVTKQCRLSLQGARPLAEAISSAGGISWRELDQNLMVRKVRGLYAVGEMVAWEAPTGGYLLQGCFSTGTLAGQAAAAYCSGALLGT